MAKTRPAFKLTPPEPPYAAPTITREQRAYLAGLLVKAKLIDGPNDRHLRTNPLWRAVFEASLTEPPANPVPSNWLTVGEWMDSLTLARAAGAISYLRQTLGA